MSSDANQVIVAAFLTGLDLLDSRCVSSAGIFRLQPPAGAEEPRTDLAALGLLQVVAGVSSAVSPPVPSAPPCRLMTEPRRKSLFNTKE